MECEGMKKKSVEKEEFWKRVKDRYMMPEDIRHVTGCMAAAASSMFFS